MSRYPNPLPHLRSEAARQLVANPMLTAAPSQPHMPGPGPIFQKCMEQSCYGLANKAQYDACENTCVKLAGLFVSTPAAPGSPMAPGALTAPPGGPAHSEPSGWVMSCQKGDSTLICKPIGKGVLECKCHHCVEVSDTGCKNWISYQPSLDPEPSLPPGSPPGLTARPPKPQDVKLSCKKGKLICAPFQSDDGEPAFGCICAKVDKDGNPIEILGPPTVQPVRPGRPGALATPATPVPAQGGCKACQMCGGTCIWDPFENKLTCPGASAKCLASAMDLVQATKPKQPYRPSRPTRHPGRRAISARAGIYRRTR